MFNIKENKTEKNKKKHEYQLFKSKMDCFDEVQKQGEKTSQ